MKACIIGAGSIGCRHIRNLKSLLGDQVEIHVYRHQKGKKLAEDILEYVDREIFCMEEADSIYDAIFVTNPTVLHFATIQQWQSYTKHFFVEKPIFDSLKYDDSIFSDNIYVACPMRHSAVFQYVKDYIKDKRVFSARAVSSSYLPDWRPNQDYREVYSAKKELGGGVVIDLIHEWDYVIDLFGMPEFQTVYHGKYSDLEITSDDLSAAILEYKDKLVEIHLDYFGRKNVRKLEIYLEGETIEADYINSMILLGNGKKIELLEESNEKYLRELKYYLRLLEGKEDNINDYKKAKQVLGLALGELL